MVAKLEEVWGGKSLQKHAQILNAENPRVSGSDKSTHCKALGMLLIDMGWEFSAWCLNSQVHI